MTVESSVRTVNVSQHVVRKVYTIVPRLGFRTSAERNIGSPGLTDCLSASTVKNGFRSEGTDGLVGVGDDDGARTAESPSPAATASPTTMATTAARPPIDDGKRRSAVSTLRIAEDA